MDAIRKIVNSDVLVSVVDIPASLKNRQVEIIILPVSDTMQKRYRKESSYGILRSYANKDLITSEDGAWEKAAGDKYALH